MKQLLKTFCNSRAWLAINPDCTGESGIYGAGSLKFNAPTHANESLLGSPFIPSHPDLGYAPEFRHLANVEHEAIHHKLCEVLFNTVSPNHLVLCADVHDTTTILVWREVEERLVTAVQYALNTGIIAPNVESFMYGAPKAKRSELLFEVVLWAQTLRLELTEFMTDCVTFTNIPKRLC